ncbi:MAG: calcium-binding protein, partial [Microcoleaceae cyanobacterium]
MFSQIPEKQMNIVRWLLSCAWLLLIVSLFYDPVSLWLTSPSNNISPLRVDPYGCIKVQAECLPQNAYILGPSLFWGVIIPVIILSLLVFGHELWRRICPLAFMSQISKFLGKQRYLKKIDPETGKSRLELAKVQPNSW